MKKYIPIMLVCAFIFSTTLVNAGQGFPEVALTGKLSEAQKTYLGVQSDTIKVSDIKGDYLFVEAYSMYCPICQRDAPKVNKLYEKVAGLAPKETVKFIGLAMGNTLYEVSFYQKKYNVVFPVFADADYVIHKALGEIGTPTFYILKLGPSPEILYKKVGEITDEAALLEIIKSKTGLK